MAENLDKNGEKSGAKLDEIGAKFPPAQHPNIIKNGAIFIADAHENGANRAGFWRFLCELSAAPTPPPQIFLMGDLFDYLSFTRYSRRIFSRYIRALNALATRCEIFYFEGNHDFNLAEIFPQMRVFPLAAQPQIFATAFGERVELAHGDAFLPLLDALALRALRSRGLLRVLDWLDGAFGWWITKRILRAQRRKRLDYQIADFGGLIARKIRRYRTARVCEGHYHQGKIVEFVGGGGDGGENGGDGVENGEWKISEIDGKIRAESAPNSNLPRHFKVDCRAQRTALAMTAGDAPNSNLTNADDNNNANKTSANDQENIRANGVNATGATSATNTNGANETSATGANATREYFNFAAFAVKGEYYKAAFRGERLVFERLVFAPAH